MAKCVLIVDDYPEIREFIALLLQQYGYDVQTAGKGEEALELMKTTVFDLVIADLHLTGPISGMEVLAHHHRAWPDKGRMLITASPYPWGPGICKTIGAIFMPKPFRLRELFLKVSAMLDGT